jgi:hypothetical protein
LPAHGLAVKDVVASPIRGPAGNAEFLALISPGLPPPDLAAAIEAALEQVHSNRKLPEHS